MGDVLKSRAVTPIIALERWNCQVKMVEPAFLEYGGAVDFEDCLVGIFVLFGIAHTQRYLRNGTTRGVEVEVEVPLQIRSNLCSL